MFAEQHCSSIPGTDVVSGRWVSRLPSRIWFLALIDAYTGRIYSLPHQARFVVTDLNFQRQ